MNPELDNHPGWKWCTFEGAELHSLLLGLETSLREKILWAEEMQKIQECFTENRIKLRVTGNQAASPQT